MKDIKNFILESSSNNSAIQNKLDQQECPLKDEDWFDENDLFSYAVVPNIKEFADKFKLDYVGKCWALSQELNVEYEDYNMPLDIMPHSYSYSDESLENFDYYVNQWEKATAAEKSKTIKILKKAIKDAE